MNIHPEIDVTPDNPTVKFRLPKEQVDLNVEIPKILKAQGWGLGVCFRIQFISHDRTQLLSSADFIVTGYQPELQTSADPYSPNTKEITLHSVEQMSDWHITKAGAAKPRNDGVEVKWNPGKQKFQAKKGEEVLYESANKAEVEKFAEAA